MTDASDASRDPRDQQLQRLCEALRRFAPPFARYVRGEFIDKGAMGVVDQANDQLLDRTVALKTLRAREESATERDRRLRRFLFEARVTGGLDHPAIVSVHDVGFDETGAPYFAMKLVRGEPLSQSFERLSNSEEAWTLSRLVAVLQRVCEAMSYAHQKGVLHRDLKPSNVMVGRFGEVYVMDWGLARSLDAPDETDIRVSARTPATEQIGSINSESELRTADGDIIGTPAYMPPEQAHGRTAQMGPRSDIYSAGAMLYHLLAGHMPYVPKFSRVGAHTLFHWVREGPPTDLATLAPQAPPELVAICNKAMAREPEQRFASMDEFADELRRYLEGRVVLSHRTGPIIELRKWAGRNRVAATLAIATPLLLLGAGGMTLRAREHSLEEERFRNDVLTARELVSTARRLGPLEPRNAATLSNWISRSEALLKHAAKYRQDLLDASARADEQSAALPEVVRHSNAAYLADQFRLMLERREAMVRSEDPALRARAQFVIPIASAERDHWTAVTERTTPDAELLARRALDSADSARVDALLELCRNLYAIQREFLPRVRADLAAATALTTRTIEEVREDWADFQKSVRDPAQCPHYVGLPSLAPQPGLVPLGRNPRSRLWEFWHVLSGERPQRDESGEWRPGASTGVILVLLPGRPANAEQGALDPYFIGKYELTQGQWLNLTAEISSEHFSGLFPVNDRSWRSGPAIVSRLHPTESVSWTDADAELRRVGLALPTEAQFEAAAMAESRALPSDPSILVGYANMRDQEFRVDRPREDQGSVETVTDGFGLHAPVGSFAPNEFGIFDLQGNVAEWCADWYTRTPNAPRLPGTLEQVSLWRRHKVIKGGSYKDRVRDLDVTARLPRSPDARDDFIGVRAARQVDIEVP